jgi:hypothetical protein
MAENNREVVELRTRASRRQRRVVSRWGLLVGLLVAMPAVAQDAPTAVPPGQQAAPVEHPDNQVILQEIDLLKRRIEALEQQLAESKKAPPAKPAVDADALKAKNGSRLTVSGYAETRFTDIGSATGDRTAKNVTDFQVARFRPRLTYLMDPKHFQAALQLNASTRSGAAASVNTRDAYLEYDNTGFYARMGQQKIPYGYEVFREGDEVRPALERARVFGVLFPDERDLGFTVASVPKSARSPVVSLGVVNGDGINKIDGDKQKSVAANIIVPLGSHHVLGGSVYTGATTATVGGKLISQVKNAYGVEHRLNLGRLSTQAEYLWGRAFGADVNGGYGQIGYNTGQRGNLFVRYDVFDPHDNAPRDYWARTSIGWYKDFTRQFRLTGEYDLVTNRLLPHAHPNTFGVELQGNF